MRDYADENYLHARIHALRSRLLALPDYVSLSAKQGDSSPDKASGTLDPGSWYEALFQEQIAPLLPLAGSCEMYAPLFLAFFRQFEALNAKLLAAKSFGLSTPEPWYDIGPYALLKKSLLLEKPDLSPIRTLLKDTYLASAFEELSDYGQIESRVDFCAAKAFYDASALFSSGLKSDFQELMGRRVAMTSLILSLRLKKTYLWGDEKIQLFLEKFQEAFGGPLRPQIKRVKDLLFRYLGQVRSGGAPDPSVADCERYLEQSFYNWISSLFHRDYHSIYCVAAYLWMLYCQIRNLFKISEGRRFGFSAERILSGIFCTK